MRVKMLIEFDFNPETGEYTPINRTIVNDDIKKAKSTIKDDGSKEPIVTLEDNKLVLNSKAVELLGAEWEDRISIIYQKHGNNLVPVIGKDDVFNCKSVRLSHVEERLIQSYLNMDQNLNLYL